MEDNYSIDEILNAVDELQVKKSQQSTFAKIKSEERLKASNRMDKAIKKSIDMALKDNLIIGEGMNNVIADKDVSSHAEINAIRSASKKLGNYRLNDCYIYVTLEPCHMCAKAIVDARIKFLIFAIILDQQ